MNVEMAWIATCSRCKMEESSYTGSREDAEAEFLEWGWTSEYPRTYCPRCNTEFK